MKTSKKGKLLQPPQEVLYLRSSDPLTGLFVVGKKGKPCIPRGKLARAVSRAPNQPIPTVSAKNDGSKRCCLYLTMATHYGHFLDISRLVMDGAYNFRIIQYANGSVEIRKYSSPVNAIYEGESTIEPIYQKPKKREGQKEYNPFPKRMSDQPEKSVSCVK